MRERQKGGNMAEDVTICNEIPAKKPRLDKNDLSDDNPLPSFSNTKTTDVTNGYLTEKYETSSCSTNHDDPKPNNHCDVGASEETKVEESEVNDGTSPAQEDSDNMSDISILSDLSEDAWQSNSGSMVWVQRQMMSGADPREILSELIPSDVFIPDDVDSFTLWKIIVNIISEPPRRQKLSQFNKIEDVLHLMKTCKRIMVLTGAGVSVSCGIPDFRSRNGIYARLAIDFPDLPDPQSMFDIRYFTNDPRPFFKFAKEIYPGQFEPSKSHKFIKLLEDQEKLLRNYTQNIDTLEQVAGIHNVIQCHGSFAKATCMVCKHKVNADDIKTDIFNQVIPHCPNCPAEDLMAVMKPDIVFFGESLPEEFHKQMAADKDQCDLLIVIGSSLKVRPVALIPNSLPPEIPQILINREPLQHMTFDVELLGNCDNIVTELCKQLGWGGLDDSSVPSMEEVTRDQLKTPPPPDPFLETPSSQTSESGNVPALENTSNNSSSVVRNNSNNTNVTKDSAPDLVASFGITGVVNTVQDFVTPSGIDNNESDIALPQTSKSTESAEKECTNQAQHNELDVSQPDSMSKEDCGMDSEATSSKHMLDSDKTNVDLDDVKESQGEVGLENENSLAESDLEMMRKMWQPKRRESLAKMLEDNQYLYLPPCRYVFPGAEVYSSGGEESDDDDQLSDLSSASSDSKLLCDSNTEEKEEDKLHDSQCLQEASSNSKMLCDSNTEEKDEKLDDSLCLQGDDGNDVKNSEIDRSSVTDKQTADSSNNTEIENEEKSENIYTSSINNASSQ